MAVIVKNITKKFGDFSKRIEFGILIIQLEILSISDINQPAGMVKIYSSLKKYKTIANMLNGNIIIDTIGSAIKFVKTL